LAWALVMGVVGALLGRLIRSLALRLRPIVHLNRVLVTPALGLLIGLTAMAYQLISGDTFTQVLFPDRTHFRSWSNTPPTIRPV
jgi:predicted membrane protein